MVVGCHYKSPFWAARFHPWPPAVAWFHPRLLVAWTATADRSRAVSPTSPGHLPCVPGPRPSLGPFPTCCAGLWARLVMRRQGIPRPIASRCPGWDCPAVGIRSRPGSPRQLPLARGCVRWLRRVPGALHWPRPYASLPGSTPIQLSLGQEARLPSGYSRALALGDTAIYPRCRAGGWIKFHLYGVPVAWGGLWASA